MSDANPNLFGNAPKLSLLGNMMRLLSAGILGTILFVVLLILLLPVLLIIMIYAWIFRWRLQRAVRKMAKQHEAMFREGVREAGYAQAGSAMPDDEPEVINPETGRKKINVTVTTVETE
jgi:uncharacterized paraquat-inducible protein A